MSSNNSPVLGPMNSATPGSSGIAANSAGMSDLALKDIYSLVHLITVPEKRENALLELSKRREASPDLGPILWHSFGTIAVLLQEIMSIYPMLSPATLSPQSSNRVCNALALLQCIASHPDTKSKLMQAYIPLYLFPFLNTVSATRPYEYLRLTSLGVIGALVKVDDPEVVNFLISTEIIPLCLRIMEIGSDLSKTVATFIIQKILLDDNGLAHICMNSERFYAVNNVLSSMVSKLVDQQSARLLKHIIRCYLRLSENEKAREILSRCLPDVLRDQTFAHILRSEEAAQRWLSLLLKNLSGSGMVNSQDSMGNLNSSVNNSIPLSGSNNNMMNLSNGNMPTNLRMIPGSIPQGNDSSVPTVW